LTQSTFDCGWTWCDYHQAVAVDVRLDRRLGRHLALNGKTLIDGALERGDRIRGRLQQQGRFTVIDKSIHETEGVASGIR
jgi:hypothetical protein